MKLPLLSLGEGPAPNQEHEPPGSPAGLLASIYGSSVEHHQIIERLSAQMVLRGKEICPAVGLEPSVNDDDIVGDLLSLAVFAKAIAQFGVSAAKQIAEQAAAICGGGAASQKATEMEAKLRDYLRCHYGALPAAGPAASCQPKLPSGSHAQVVTDSSPAGTPLAVPAPQGQPNLELMAKDEAEVPLFVFCKVGPVWKVVFAGGLAFYLDDTLGAHYLDYLLHHPNEPISAFDLEKIICPEKSGARAPNVMQKKSDRKAERAYRGELRRLRPLRRAAAKLGDRAKMRHLDSEIEALKKALNGICGTSDSGERSRNNVRKAIEGVIQNLECKKESEQAFAEYLKEFIKRGYQVLYVNPAGRIWR